MRKPHSHQKRFDCHAVNQVQLNLNCRDEIIPVLRSLQHIFSTPALRLEILKLVALDVNRDSRHALVAEGHTLAADDAKRIRVDSFVVETNIYYPTESSLIHDGVRKTIELAEELNLSVWLASASTLAQEYH